jgi:hypothetical protein
MRGLRVIAVGIRRSPDTLHGSRLLLVLLLLLLLLLLWCSRHLRGFCIHHVHISCWLLCCCCCACGGCCHTIGRPGLHRQLLLLRQHLWLRRGCHCRCCCCRCWLRCRCSGSRRH